jgi:hypothetical protein
MLPIDEIKMTKSRPGSLGVNPKLAVDIHPINLSTAPQ